MRDFGYEPKEIKRTRPIFMFLAIVSAIAGIGYFVVDGTPFGAGVMIVGLLIAGWLGEKK